MSMLDKERSWIARDFGLNKRLVKAVSKLGYVYPTVVQAQSIPLALQGKDVLVRARTGSGKTVAFSLPLLDKILTIKEEGDTTSMVRAIVLAPTNELARQIEKNISELLYYCRDIMMSCVLNDESKSSLQNKLRKRPDVVVSTPAKLAAALSAGYIDLTRVHTLVIDEADLVLSFGYTQEVYSIISKMPKFFQGILMSATLSPELEKFKKMLLHNPVILKLDEMIGIGDLVQFYLPSTEDDKFLILYVFLKLGLLQGKGLVFVNDVNAGYKLKLFLQQFHISAAVLNSEVPLNSRVHVIEEYNRGIFDLLIATDDSMGETQNSEGDDDGNDDDDDNDEELDTKKGSNSAENSDSEGDERDDRSDDGESDDEIHEGCSADVNATHNTSESSVRDGASALAVPQGKSTSRDCGVSRGIDFEGVSFVVNFDFPLSAASYTHRVGRTARAGASGTALSFVREDVQEEWTLLADVQSQQPRLDNAGGENVLATMGTAEGNNGNSYSSQSESQSEDPNSLQPGLLLFNMKELDSFRYRVGDTLRSVTATAIKSFRVSEIKREVLNSAALKSHFSENPNDLKVLRHDKANSHPIRQKDHLKHIPDYLVPAGMRHFNPDASRRGKRKRVNKAGVSAEDKISMSKARDPLSTQSLSNENQGSVEYVLSDADLKQSTSGRQKWKERHGKGKFNTKKKTFGVKGSFAKFKQYK
jgi:ATP-dependent RNA helicase DDX56/DBP9